MSRATGISVCHISNYDVVGGASRAAFRLHSGLQLANVTSRMLVGSRIRDDASIAEIPRGPRGFRALEWRIDRLLRALGFADLALPSATLLMQHPWIRNSQVIHLHKVHGGHFSLGMLPWLSKRKTIVWTLHDMWALTGYCYQALACERWRHGCGLCPQIRTPHTIPIRLERPPRFDTSAILWRAKRRLYRGARMAIVTPSRWLLRAAQASPLLENAEVRLIPYAVDLKRFKPENRTVARRRVDLPLERKIVLMLSGKGEDLLWEALLHLSASAARSLTLVSLGAPLRAPSTPLPCELIQRPQVSDDEVLATYYAAADCFVLPSYADNLPNTVMESLACGTAVVATDVGGVSELVQHLKTGYLARPDDSIALANGLRCLLEDAGLARACGEEGRRRMAALYGIERQAHAYCELYEELLGCRDEHSELNADPDS